MSHPPQAPGPGTPGQGPGPQPTSADPLSEFGLKPNPARPQKVNWLTQALWGYFGVSVLMLVFAIIAVATASWWIATGPIIAMAVVGLIFHALSVVIVWFIVKEKLGAFGAADPRTPLLIGFGILGFFSLGGFYGIFGWYAIFGVLLSLARLGAVGLAFWLVFQPEVHQWLLSRPGNQRKNPPMPPQGQPPQGYQQPGQPYPPQQQGAQQYPPQQQGTQQYPPQQPPSHGHPPQQG